MDFALARAKDSVRFSVSWMPTSSASRRRRCRKDSLIWPLRVISRIGTMPIRKAILVPLSLPDTSLSMWRLMIDDHYQGKGYGKEAVRLALDFIRTRPCGSADYCWLSYEPENDVARKLYQSFGFTETGEYDGEEMIAVLELGGASG